MQGGTMRPKCATVAACVYGLVGMVAIALVMGCSPERKETPTRGRTTVLVSESMAPIMEQEQREFEDLYREAKIDARVTTTRDAIVQFFNVDSIKTIVASRPMNEEERSVAKRYQIDFAEYKIAFDGLAIVVHHENPVKQLRTTQLDSVFCGITTKWSQVGWKNSTTSIEICLPQQDAGEFEVMATKILHGAKFGPASKVVTSSSAMLEYVAGHSNSIGIVSVGRLGDYKEKVNVLELCDPNAPDSLGISGQYFTPHQAHIYRGYYPLTSDVYIYCRADMYSVASGFITFITSAPGQKIVLNNGLVPATMPVRLVELTNKSLQP